MYLLDTNVVSELRRVKPHGGVVAWLRTVDQAALFLPAVALGDLQAGIARARVQNAEKAREIEAWLDKVAIHFNVLAMNGEAFRLWAKLMMGRSDEVYEDAMIAATAMVNRLTVATRHERDFRALGVEVFNPFAGG